MVKIVKLGRDAQVGLAAPRPSRVQGVGIAGRALATVGQQIAQGGQKVASAFAALEDKRRKAEILDFGDTKSFEFRKGLNQRIRENKNSFSGTDHKGYSQDVQEFIEDFRETIVSDSEDEEAIKLFNTKIRGFTEGEIIRSQNYESSERARHIFGNKLRQSQQVSLAVLENPDPFTADSEITNFEAGMRAQKDISFTGKQIESTMDALREQSRDSMVFGQIRDGLPGLINESMTSEQKKESIKLLLDGKLAGTENLFQDMSASEKRVHSTRMLQALKIQEKRESTEVRELVKNTIHLYENEDTFNPEIQNEIIGAKLRLNNLPESADKARLLKAINNAEIVSEFKRGSGGLSNKELASTDLDSLIPVTGLQDADVDVRSRKALKDIQADIIQERNEDGKAYLDKIFPGLSINTDASIAQQRQWGVRRPRVISKSEATVQSNAILDDTNPRGRAQKIQEVVDRFGAKYGFQALSEMADENKNFHRGYAFSAFFRNPQTQEKVISALSNRARNKEDFTKSFGAAQSRILKTNIGSKLKDHVTAFHKAELGDFANQYIEMVEAVTIEAALRDAGKPISEIVEETVNDLINNNFTIIENDKSTIIMPLVSETNKRKVEAFLDVEFDADFVKQLGISKAFYSSALTDEEFVESIQENSFWAMTRAGDGVVLKATDGAFTDTVRDSEGAPVEFKFNQMGQLQQVLDELN